MLPSALEESARPVAPDDVSDAGKEEKLCSGRAAGADAVDDNLQVGQLLPYDLQGVDEGGHDHNGSPMLVIVEYRNVQLLPQPLLDLEAARG